MSVPKFQTVSIDSPDNHTDNAKLAATIYAFDVPLDPAQPWSVIAGDGIKGTRVVWHFSPLPHGLQPGDIAKRWASPEWLALNPCDPLAVCKSAFAYHFQMVTAIKQRFGFGTYAGPCIVLHTTRAAAVLAAIGHPILGWEWSDNGVAWKMPQAAAADAALFATEDLYTVLPNEAISYAKGAILGHAIMVDKIKEITMTRHEHRGRIALIGRNCPDANILTLEKILYRK